jgi:transketolase
MSKLEKKIINETKILGLDMINQAQSGHPGIVLSASEIIYSLYAEELNYKRSLPYWFNRDRFVLSSGHGSALLYASLYMAGFPITINDLQNFRSLNSITPGHPEYDLTPGVDSSTGPLGQGIGIAVGLALSERYFEKLITELKPKSKIIDYYTYCLCGDGDLMEGISYESLSFAATQKLNKLIILYDHNRVSLDSKTDLTFDEDVESRFDALGFTVLHVKDSNSVDKICEAIEKAKKSKMPSIIIVDTILGKGLPNEGSNLLHGKPLAKEELNNYKTKLDHTLEPFTVDQETRETYIKNIDDRCNEKYVKWVKEFESIRSSGSEKLNRILDLLEKDNLNLQFDDSNFKINDTYFEDLRLSNNKIMNFISNKTPLFLGGSADVSSSCKTNLKDGGIMSDDNPLGKNIFFGVRENAMGAILNGMALTNLRVFSSCYLSFSDYLKPSLRMSSLMDLPITYIFTHDSLSSSKDGPTHEPIEELSMLITTPNLTVLRPCDINEVIGSWEYIMKNRCPIALVIGNEGMPKYHNTNAKYVKYGAYMIKKEKYHLDGIIVSSGTDISLAMETADDLFEEGIDLRVVSMPSVNLFLKQNPKYEEQLLDKSVKTFVITSNNSLIWNRFATNPNCIFGVDKFGKSGDLTELKNELGLNKETIKRKIKENL